MLRAKDVYLTTQNKLIQTRPNHVNSVRPDQTAKTFWHLCEFSLRIDPTRAAIPAMMIAEEDHC